MKTNSSFKIGVNELVIQMFNEDLETK